jgi:hypothetical protein
LFGFRNRRGHVGLLFLSRPLQGQSSQNAKRSHHRRRQTTLFYVCCPAAHWRWLSRSSSSECSFPSFCLGTVVG